MIAHGDLQNWRGRLLEEPISPGESLRRLHTVIRGFYGKDHTLEAAARDIIENHTGIRQLAPDDSWTDPYWFGRCLCHEPDATPITPLSDAVLGAHPDDQLRPRLHSADPESDVRLLRPTSELADDIGWMLHLGEREITLRWRAPQPPGGFGSVCSVRLDSDPTWRPLVKVVDVMTYGLREMAEEADVARKKPGESRG